MLIDDDDTQGIPMQVAETLAAAAETLGTGALQRALLRAGCDVLDATFGVRRSGLATDQEPVAA